MQILWADARIVAVQKPSGLLVHRGLAADDVVLMTLVRDHVGAHVHPVHRLDRGTSGVVLFALDPDTARALGAAFEAGAIEKTYLAWVRGVPPERFEVDHPVPRAEDGPRVPAKTAFETIFVGELEGRRHAVLRARPETGRFHQIRRHLKHVSHPILGDVNYGKGEYNRLFRRALGLNRLALHAARIAFPHPSTGERLEIAAPIPPDLAEPLARFGAPAERLG